MIFALNTNKNTTLRNVDNAAVLILSQEKIQFDNVGKTVTTGKPFLV